MGTYQRMSADTNDDPGRQMGGEAERMQARVVTERAHRLLADKSGPGQMVEITVQDRGLGIPPEQQALRQEERRRLAEALQQLEPHQRQVLHLRFSVGLRCAQIGLVMGKREDAVRKLLSRTLTSLRRLYGER